MLPEQRPVPVCSYFDLKYDPQTGPYIESRVRGIALLRFVLLNKSTAFTLEERRELQVDGLLPTRVSTFGEQIERAYTQFRNETTDLGRYQFLRGLQERQEVLFYAVVATYLEEMLPIVYTPTVGEAVEKFSALFQTPRGLTVNDDNIDRLPSILDCFPMFDIRAMVVTDSSAILGIGDQGYGGMGISIGKLTLYTVGGGVSPFYTLPVCLDVGTDHDTHRADPMYLGDDRARLKGEAYDAFIDKFVTAVHGRWPEAIIQWEDLSKDAAFEVLERYRHKVPCLNDDIQGTGAVTLAGVLSACRLKGERLRDQRIAIHGAGAGGIGVAMAIRDGLIREGLTLAEALERIYVHDSKGLMLSNRSLSGYKRAFAHDPASLADWTYEGDAPDLLDTVREAGVTVLLGLSGQARAFSEDIVRAAAANTSRPVVFPLSNPTKLAEALPSDVLAWTNGRAIVATGSPFSPVTVNGREVPIGQGNNAFVFPGLGLGSMLARVRSITDEMVLAAAYAVSAYTAREHGDSGLIFPPLRELPAVSREVAAAVVRQAVADGVAREHPPLHDLDAWIEARWWHAKYLPLRYREGALFSCEP